eukprot:SAG11_NODE_93_length_17080_cov_10.504093_18_plen_119_part_00
MQVSLVESAFINLAQISHDKLEEWAQSFGVVLGEAVRGAMKDWNVTNEEAINAVVATVQISVSPDKIHVILGGDIIGAVSGERGICSGEHMRGHLVGGDFSIIVICVAPLDVNETIIS